MSGRLPWVAATVVIVIAAGLGAWALSQPAVTTQPPTTTPGASFGLVGEGNVTIGDTGSAIGLVSGAVSALNENNGIENIYIMTHTGKTWENNQNLSGNGEVLGVISSDAGSQNIAYETKFAIVVAVRIFAPDNMAYAVQENSYAYITTAGEWVDTENTEVLPEYEFNFENENYGTTAGYIRYNFVYDNDGNGWSLRAGQSVTLNPVSVYGWK